MKRIRPIIGRALIAATALATVSAGLSAVVPSASAATSYNYVTMGDSLSSGEGTYNYLSGTNTTTNVCHRSSQSYAAQFASLSISDWSLTNVACSGAGTDEIPYVANPNTGGNADAGELAQDLALSSSTRLVTLSIGINDLGLISTYAYNCYNQGSTGSENSCFTAIPTLGSYQQSLAALPSELDFAYSDIRDAAPNATVAVLTYPEIFPATYTGSCESYPTAVGPDALVTSQAMLDTVHTLIGQLNSAITTEVAKYPNFILVDETNALAGHDVCASTPWVNQLNGITILHRVADEESLHPTATGYLAMAKILANRLDAGHFSDGSTDSAVEGAYEADGGPGGLGFPADNGGGAYVHYWGAPKEDVEDFSNGSFGPATLVDGPNGTYFVNYGFRTAYISGGYASTCLAPTDNAYSYAGGTRQDFVNCYMTWTSAGGVVVHGPNPTTCTNYGGSTITGPNACTGFFTAPPSGQPASGNVWYSGGGVGLDGQELWTYGNGTTATSTAHYSLSGLATARASQLQAYIPDGHADASHAHYHFCTPSGGCADGYVNQNDYTNQWATFGTVCTSDGTATIALADDGGDAYPAEVGADAIRAVPTGIAC
jgi:lysophospholipase L1-like esterase